MASATKEYLGASGGGRSGRGTAEVQCAACRQCIEFAVQSTSTDRSAQATTTPPPFFPQTLELSTWQYGSKDGFPTSCMVASMLPGYVILLIYLYTQMQGRKARCTRTRSVCTEVLGLFAAVLVQHRYADTHKTKPSIHPMLGADACLEPARISDASGLTDGGKF